jgi:hypothetical protein
VIGQPCDSEVYRERQNVKHTLNMDQAFLQFLDKMDEQAQLQRAECTRFIDRKLRRERQMDGPPRYAGRCPFWGN